MYLGWQLKKRDKHLCNFCVCTIYGTVLHIKCFGLSQIKNDTQLAFMVPDSSVNLYFSLLGKLRAVPKILHQNLGKKGLFTSS